MSGLPPGPLLPAPELPVQIIEATPLVVFLHPPDARRLRQKLDQVRGTNPADPDLLAIVKHLLSRRGAEFQSGLKQLDGTKVTQTTQTTKGGLS